MPESKSCFFPSSFLIRTCTHFSPHMWQVSCWSITQEAGLQSQASWCRICLVDKVALGQVFLQVLWFSTARIMGYAMGQLVEALHYKPEGCGFISRWCHWNFSLTQSIWLHCGPGVDSASNRNEYQEYFLGGKGSWCIGLTTWPPSCADCLEIWEPHPSGTLRVCPGL